MPLWVFMALLLTAWVVLWPASLHPGTLLPGSSETVDLQATAQYHWLTHDVGFWGATHSRLQMYPLTIDRVALSGIPIDALLSWPFLKVLGWPSGFTVFWIVVLWGVGLSHGWLASCWWRSPVAGCVGGVLAQLAAPVLHALYGGRPSELVGVLFVPLVLGCFVRALAVESLRNGLLSGLFLAFATVSSWVSGLVCVLGLCVVAALGFVEGLRLRLAGLATLVTAGLVSFVPLTYAYFGRDQQGNLDAGIDDIVQRTSGEMPLVEFLENNDLGALVDSGGVAVLPVLLVLCLVAIRGQPTRSWIAPTVWVLAALMLAVGPWLRLSDTLRLPGPWMFVTAAPLLQRLWWPDRALMLMVPGVAILGAGGAAWIAQNWLVREGGGLRRAVFCGVLCATLWGEAVVGLDTLPIPSTDGRPSAEAVVLARDDGPLLVLPHAVGDYKSDRRIFFDQIHHGRPLANGVVQVGSNAAPSHYTLIWGLPSMRYLFECKTAESQGYGWADDGLEILQRLGIETVVVEGRAFPGGEPPESYLSCVEALLGDPESTVGTLRIYAI